MLKFEHKSKALAPRHIFYSRLFRYALYSILILFVSLMAGVVGYHYFGQLPWIDSLVNASMILTGMGPVDTMPDNKGKIFESVYALYSGVAFLTTVAVLLAPVVHRFLHALHIDDNRINKD